MHMKENLRNLGMTFKKKSFSLFLSFLMQEEKCYNVKDEKVMGKGGGGI